MEMFERVQRAVTAVCPTAVFTEKASPSELEIDVIDPDGGDSIHISVYPDWPGPHVHGWAHGICGRVLMAVLKAMRPESDEERRWREAAERVTAAWRAMGDLPPIDPEYPHIKARG